MRISDWSSDVCSSDLVYALLWLWSILYPSSLGVYAAAIGPWLLAGCRAHVLLVSLPLMSEKASPRWGGHLPIARSRKAGHPQPTDWTLICRWEQIGRATCRARVWQYV